MLNEGQEKSNSAILILTPALIKKLLYFLEVQKKDGV
tara:strand:+ start:22 stop:132 length:111 start_codon:yes stop_codon:yes gene_type:complete